MVDKSRYHLSHLQGFVPLAILTVPFATFITFIFTGANLNNWTLMLTFSLWSLPAVQVGQKL